MVKKRNCVAVCFLLCLSLLAVPTCYAQSRAVLPPDLPFWASSDVSINLDLVSSLASRYRSQYGASGTDRDFFLRYLLLASVDDLSTLPLNKQAVSAYLGNFYIAGYFGGIILRDAVFIYGGGNRDDFMGILMGAMPSVLQAVMNLGADKLIFQAIAGLAGSAVNTGLSGSAASVSSANHLGIELLLAIYGIDRGLYSYFQSIPPAGAPAVPYPLSCPTFLGCTMQGATVKPLSTYAGALSKAQNPQCWKFWSLSAMRWCEVNGSMNTLGKGASGLVGGLFQTVMGKIDVPASDYVSLVELTATSVIVAESALLPSMQGWADLDTAAGRKGLLLEAGKIMWLGSFMLGMSSDMAMGAFPDLQ